MQKTEILVAQFGEQQLNVNSAGVSPKKRDRIFFTCYMVRGIWIHILGRLEFIKRLQVGSSEVDWLPDYKGGNCTYSF